MSRVTQTQLSRSKGQLAGGGGILWRPRAQLVLFCTDHELIILQILRLLHIKQKLAFQYQLTTRGLGLPYMLICMLTLSYSI